MQWNAKYLNDEFADGAPHEGVLALVRHELGSRGQHVSFANDELVQRVRVQQLVVVANLGLLSIIRPR